MPLHTKKLPDRIAEIPRVEIFRAGQYPQGTITEADLDQIVAAYDPVGHREAQLTKDHIQGGESFGQVGRIWREGKSLWASLKNVASELVREIRAGKWHARSVEFRREPDSRWYLQAVTFLGATQPAVPGMEPIRFSDGGEGVAFEAVQFSIEPSGLRFSEMPKAPEGAAHSTLVRTIQCGSNLDHWHDCYLDSDGNGFSSPPRSYDGNWDVVEETGGHQHVISGGAVQAAADPSHTHELSIVEVRTTVGDESTEQETTDMSDKTEITKAEFADLTAQAAKVPALETEVKELKAKLAERDAADAKAASDRLFAEAFDRAAAAGKVLPAERDALAATFAALPSDSVVRFGDKEVSTRQHFLASLEARPAVIPMGEAGRPGSGAPRQKPGAEHSGVRNHATHDRAVKIQAERGCDYGTAVQFALAEADRK